MSGEHNLWEGLQPLPDPHAREVQMAYVDGYRLGVEESLKGIGVYQAKFLEGATGTFLSRQDQETIQIINTVFRGCRKVLGRRLAWADTAMKLLKGDR